MINKAVAGTTSDNIARSENFVAHYTAVSGSSVGGGVTSGLYEVPLTFSTGLTRTVDTITVNNVQNIIRLANLTTNGFVKTILGDGTLSIDTSTYLTTNQTITLAGDVTGSGTTAITATISSSAVTNNKLANMPANTVKGNNTGGSATPIDLTQLQFTAMVNTFTSALSGAVPASGGGTTNFLRADGTWAVVSGTPAGSTTQIQYNNAGAFGASSGFTYTTGGVGMALDGANVQTLSANGVSGDVQSVTANGKKIFFKDASGTTVIKFFGATAVFQTAALTTVAGVDTGGYTDVTTTFNAGFINITNGGASLKRFYIGYYQAPPNNISTIFDNPAGGTAGIGGTIIWERWNGAAWVSFTGNNLTATAWFQATASSARNNVNGVSAYWIRGTVNTGYSTAPVFRFVPISGMFNANISSTGYPYNSALWIEATATPSGSYSGMTDFPIIGVVCPGNGEQNIMTAWSSYSGNKLFSIDGGGSIVATSAENQCRSLKLGNGAGNFNGALGINAPTGFSGYENYQIGINFSSGRNFDVMVVQRNGTITARWKENNEFTVTGNLFFTQPADRALTVGTTTVNASTTVTGVSTQFLREVSKGDYISVSSSPATFVLVTAVTTDTALTVASNIGNGTSQTITVRKPLLRLNDNTNTQRVLVDHDGSLKLNGNLGFYNTTPITQPVATTDLGTVLSNLGLRAAGTAYPITTSGTVTLTGNGVTADNLIFNNNAITAVANAATVPVTFRLHTVTNNSAATLTITITTSSAVDGQLLMVRVKDFSAVAQTLAWVNTENSATAVPVITNGSTTLPLTVGFQFNNATTKWRCLAVS